MSHESTVRLAGYTSKWIVCRCRPSVHHQRRLTSSVSAAQLSPALSPNVSGHFPFSSWNQLRTTRISSALASPPAAETPLRLTIRFPSGIRSKPRSTLPAVLKNGSSIKEGAPKEKVGLVVAGTRTSRVPGPGTYRSCLPLALHSGWWPSSELLEIWYFAPVCGKGST